MATIAVASLLYVYSWCRMFSKAGFHGSLGLLTLVPLMMIVLPLWLAFAPWPADRQLRGLKRMQRAVHKADERHQKFDRAA